MSNKITLCLSGGGFRATIFHLGVIDFLAQTNQLAEVGSVYGVSGGAITAAHLAHYSAQYADTKLFPKAALELLRLCNKGIIDNIAWSSLLWQRVRSRQLIREIEGLFKTAIPTHARPTYLLCSSLSDTSQFGVELRSQELFRLKPDLISLERLGPTSISTARAAAMSACFPMAFEPMRLNAEIAGLDRTTFGDDHIVADGGIVDNFGIAIAQALERDVTSDHIFLVSDAGQIFDQFEREEEDIATVLSPMRTISYLMGEHARLMFSGFSATGAGKIVTVRLVDARKVSGSQFGIDPTLIRRALRTRTNFDSFSVDEILTIYRLGIIVAMQVFGCNPQHADTLGLIKEERLGGRILNVPWKDIKIDTRSDLLGRAVELLLRKPGLILLAGIAVLFFAFVALGITIRAFR
jgi:predicted acylesterase/phospholipase RssA